MDAQPNISVVILTFNSAATIERTVRAVMPLSDDIHIVDSYSTDDTVSRCNQLGCEVVQHAFENYAAQRNWAIDNLPLRHPWQLHVDADEELTPTLVRAIAALDLNNSAADGYIVGRKMVFMGRVLRFGAIAKTWHYRLFRTGYGRCEDRLYDQHFVSLGKVARIDAFMLDHQDNTLSEWTARHNRWSDMEAAEILQHAQSRRGAIVRPDLAGSRIERKRALKARYYRLPLFARAVGYFLYSYVVRLGFLDGTRGFVFNALQAFWFRVLIDAKIYEAKLAAAATANATAR